MLSNFINMQCYVSSVPARATQQHCKHFRVFWDNRNADLMCFSFKIRMKKWKKVIFWKSSITSEILVGSSVKRCHCTPLGKGFLWICLVWLSDKYSLTSYFSLNFASLENLNYGILSKLTTIAKLRKFSVLNTNPLWYATVWQPGNVRHCLHIRDTSPRLWVKNAKNTFLWVLTPS